MADNNACAARSGSEAAKIALITATPSAPAARTVRQFVGVDAANGDCGEACEPSKAHKLSGADGVSRIGLGRGREDGANAHVVGARRARTSASLPTDAPMMNPAGTTARSALAGRSSTPTCTPAAAAASATSARSFTMTGTGSARTSARATCDELARVDVLEPQLHHRGAAADGSGGATDQPVGAVAQVIRDGDQSQTIGNRESGIGNRHALGVGEPASVAARGTRRGLAANLLARFRVLRERLAELMVAVGMRDEIQVRHVRRV